jgi:hypothetical protein
MVFCGLAARNLCSGRLSRLAEDLDGGIDGLVPGNFSIL